MSSESSEPKIHIDEDWKSRVEAEKQAAATKASSPDKPPAEKPTAAEVPADLDSQRRQLPPATLSFLVTTLATQAMVALGDVPNPISGKTESRLPEARHFIDTLSMLEQKTAGNRTAEESSLLDGLLHQLRMAYVEVSSGKQ